MLHDSSGGVWGVLASLHCVPGLRLWDAVDVGTVEVKQCCGAPRRLHRISGLTILVVVSVVAVPVAGMIGV